MANDSGVQPGWYADPMGRFELRYFNGTTWTADVSADGARFVDPLGLDVGERPHGGDHPSISVGGDGANAAANAAMILGIIAVATAWLPFIVVFGAIAAILAVAFGVIGLRKSQMSGVGRSRAIVGLITGGSGLLAAVLGIVLTVIVLDVYDAYVDPAAHDIEITSCSIAGSRATAVGILTNLDDTTADFSVLVGFVRPGTDNPDRESRIDVDDVAAGSSVEFTVERQVSLDAVDCIVLDVNGPLPFGLALD